jgi:hypothetical protein
MRAFFIILFLNTIIINAQRIVDYNLFVANNIVSGKFTLGVGGVCSGFIVERSIDSLSFIKIYDDPTICGISGFPEPKSFTDANPIFNQVNFYRLTLIPFETETRKIYVGQANQNMMIPFPNPISQGSNFLNLKLVNAGNINVFGYVYHQSGNRMLQLDVTTKDDLMALNIAGFENGVYLVWLTNGLTAYSTKFIVLN